MAKEVYNVIVEWHHDSHGSLWAFAAKTEVMEFIDDSAMIWMKDKFVERNPLVIPDERWHDQDPRAFLEGLIAESYQAGFGTDVFVLKYFCACGSHYIRFDKYSSGRFTDKKAFEEIFSKQERAQSNFPPRDIEEVFEEVCDPVVQQVVVSSNPGNCYCDDEYEQSPGMILKRSHDDWTWVSDVPYQDSVRMHVESYRQFGLCGSARKKFQQQRPKPKIKFTYRQRRPVSRPQKNIIGWTPRKVIRTLLWRDPTYIRNNAAVAYATWRYTPNDLTHVDPASASTIDGRTVLFSQYNTFRVLSVSVSVDFVNLEAFAVVVGFFPQGETNSDPGLNSAVIQTGFDMQPFKRSKLLGSVNGQNIATLNFPNMAITKWTGFPAARTDDNFSGINSATPNTLIYMPMAIRASSGAVTLLNGVNVDAKFKLTCEFSEMVALAV